MIFLGKSLFGKLHSPYANDDNISLEKCYNSYKQDSDNQVMVGSHVFTKIISHCRFYGCKDFSYHIIWVPAEGIRLHDLLIDENGNTFEVHSIETLHFSGDIPEWYLHALPLVIAGSSCEIGSYLAKK